MKFVIVMAEFTEEDSLDYISMSIWRNKIPTLDETIQMYSYEASKEKKNSITKQLYILLYHIIPSHAT